MPEPDHRRILMVGASGRVGRMVHQQWQNLPDAAQIVPQYRFAAGMESLLWDPLEGTRPLLEATAQSGGFSAMIMLAGVTPGQGLSLALNRTLAEACLRGAEEAEIPRVLLASSSAVYGLGDGTPFSEDTLGNPASEYGHAKLDMEQACSPWRDRGMDLCMLRIGNVAGADALMLNVVTAAPGAAIEIDIFEDGHGPQRSYIGPRTLAAVLRSLCRSDQALPPVLNVGAPAPLYMEALANAASQPWIRRDAAGKAHQRVVLNCDLLSSLHSFSPDDSSPEEMIRQWKDT